MSHQLDVALRRILTLEADLEDRDLTLRRLTAEVRRLKRQREDADARCAAMAKEAEELRCEIQGARSRP